MSKKKTAANQKLIWILIAIGAALAMILWVWPTYLAPTSFATVTVNSTASGLTGHFINVDQANQKSQEGAFLLDVRTPEEWQEGYIPGATLIPLDQLSARYGELPADQEIVIYCRSGNRSAQALLLLTEAGFTTVYSMDGGINNWITAGYEIVSGD